MKHKKETINDREQERNKKSEYNLDEILTKKLELNEGEDYIKVSTTKSASEERMQIKQTIQLTDENQEKTDSKEENQEEEMDINSNMEEEYQEATDT